MPPIRGVSWSSSDMNCGANVPTGVLLRAELDRSRAESLRPSSGLWRCVRDWLRRWPIFGSDSLSGDETRADSGRAEGGGPPGGGDCVLRAKGLLRELRAKGLPFGALIVGGLSWCYVRQARHALWNAGPRQKRRGKNRIQNRICTKSHRTRPECSRRRGLQWYCRGAAACASCVRFVDMACTSRLHKQHTTPPLGGRRT
jgi:hypothetical protein